MLAISNIAWDIRSDEYMYKVLTENGFKALEIAPTRIFAEVPYDRCVEAREWKRQLAEEYDISISSMQSIWYGRKESMFETDQERNALIEYTYKAIDFANAIGCGNLVLGCPRNRNIPDDLPKDKAYDIAVKFFRNIGEYAANNGTVIGLEANPEIYNTNFINDTESAIEIISNVDSRGFKLNLDIGTMIYNEENIDILSGHVHEINHIHISEPYLKPIEERVLHNKVKQILMRENYIRDISIEMSKVENVAIVQDKMQYVKKVFTNGI